MPRGRATSVTAPAVVTVTVGSACDATATESLTTKGQTWLALIWPQREQRYLRDGARVRDEDR